MDFKGYINESSINNLYQSAVDAFPNTRMRQHAVDPIEIGNVNMTPYVGVRTLFVRATARNEDRQYSPMILFTGVNYNEEGPIQIEYNGRPYQFNPPSIEDSDVRVRCGCGDFKWRFNYYDHVDQSLYGRVRAPYEGQGAPANPQEMPGMCKHLMKLAQILREEGLIA